MTTIEEKLDLLAEFHAQKDLLELDKKNLLNEVKIPAEIEEIVGSGIKKASELEANVRAEINAFNAKIDQEISEIVVPDEFKAALAEIDRQRAELMAKFADIEKQRQAIASKKRTNEISVSEALTIRKRALQEEIEQQTKDVYNQVEQRKNEIEAEFSGKSDDVESNIKKLESEIKAEVKAGKKSVKGKFFHAIYVSGRITWNTDKMEAWMNDHPFLKDARKEGEPSITLRRI